MTQVAAVLAAAGPWALAIGIIAAAGWLIAAGKLIPEARHRELIALYEKRAEQDERTINAQAAQIAELRDTTRLAAQTWEALRQEAKS